MHRLPFVVFFCFSLCFALLLVLPTGVCWDPQDLFSALSGSSLDMVGYDHVPPTKSRRSLPGILRVESSPGPSISRTGPEHLPAGWIETTPVPTRLSIGWRDDSFSLSRLSGHRTLSSNGPILQTSPCGPCHFARSLLSVLSGRRSILFTCRHSRAPLLNSLAGVYRPWVTFLPRNHPTRSSCSYLLELDVACWLSVLVRRPSW